MQMFLLAYLRATGAISLDQTALFNYRAGLDRNSEYMLGYIRAFLARWHDQGYPGVTADTIKLLKSFRLRGNEKGAAVKSMDPEHGPFDDLELQAFNDPRRSHSSAATSVSRPCIRPTPLPYRLPPRAARAASHRRRTCRARSEVRDSRPPPDLALSMPSLRKTVFANARMTSCRPDTAGPSPSARPLHSSRSRTSMCRT